MKYIPAIFLVLLSFTLHAGEKKYATAEEYHSSYDSLYFADIFAAPEKCISISTNPDALKYAAAYDCSKLVNLQYIRVEFTLCPDSSDAAKQVFISSLKIKLRMLAAFSKCDKLEKIHFVVGEQLFLEKSQCQSATGKFSQKERNREFKKNAEAALVVIDKEIGPILPGVKTDAETWGW